MTARNVRSLALESLVDEEPGWWFGARCRDEDPSLFDPPVRARAVDRYTRARELCDSCNVRAACLEDVLGHGPDPVKHQFHLFQAGYTPGELLTIWNERQEEAS